jgi:hypothetical protein
MSEKILLNIDNPLQLEKLYRENKPSFKAAFNDIYPQVRDNPLVEGWYQRLNYSQEGLFWGTASERTFIVGASLLAALIAQLPKIFSIDEDFFYPRNLGFIILPVLIAFFAWKNKISPKTGGILAGIILASAVFINLFPQETPGKPGDTLVLSCIHLPLLLWSMLGFTFGGGKFGRDANRLGFLRYNGELAVISALILISGGMVTAITVGLFELTGWDIKKFYFDYIVVSGLAAVPIVGTFLTQTQPTIVNKVAPLIAKLFSPVALVMLLVYLAAMVFSDKNPYQDRDFLIMFNALLVGVMALIFFSVADSAPGSQNSSRVYILFLLSAVTIIVNGIALSAVLFRITEWGITPNRAAVLGANVLMLIHLLFVAIKLFGVLTHKSDLSMVGRSVALFLPIYACWAAIVAFLFPLIFGFK